MKKIGLLLIALICSTNFYAQVWDNSKPDNDITFGIRAGANMSTWGGGEFDDYMEVESQWGFHVGLNVDFNIIKSFAIETGVFYTGKGSKMGYIYEEEGKLSYVQVPLLALIRLPISEDTHIQLKGGGYAGYLINEPETLYVKKPDMGIIVGAGINHKKLYFGLQYELGLYEVAWTDKNRNLAISVGYDF